MASLRALMMGLSLGVLLQLAACKSTHDKAPTEPRYVIEEAGISLPMLQGWQADPAVKLGDPAKGGVALRLVRESAVAGSPRMDVVIEQAQANPTDLDQFLQNNLREMGQIEARGNIHILQVDQHRVSVGNSPAYRVRHEYSVGQGTSQVAITQISTFMVHDKRGVAITVAGRTELFHPLGQSIDALLSGIKPLHDVPAPPPKATGSQPEDLGKIGDK